MSAQLFSKPQTFLQDIGVWIISMLQVTSTAFSDSHLQHGGGHKDFMITLKS